MSVFHLAVSPKMKTVGLASYPKLAADDATGDHYEENRERNFAFDSRWLNGTYEFLASSARDESGHCFRQKTIQGWR